MSSEVAKKKKAFRQKKIWKTFKHQMNVKDKGIDRLTGRKLLRGYELHHLDLRPENYSVLNEDNFVSLNKMSHKVVHFIYGYYEKDRGVLDRLKEILDKMIELNYGDKRDLVSD